MTQLLVSVKNVSEALLALHAGADVIDMKDPSVGALGALSTSEITTIVSALRKQNPQVCISATIGDTHENVDAMQQAIMQTASLGVNIVKFPLNSHTHDLKALLGISTLLSVETEMAKPLSFKTEMAKPLTSKRVILFGVLFADIALDLDLIEAAAEAGLAGVMLDTQHKTQDLLCHANHATLLNFVNRCKHNDLKSGLAGSLQVQYIDNLVTLDPSYMGFRGGLCSHLNRNGDLDVNKLEMAKLLLHKGDNKVKISYENSGATLNC